MIDDEKRLFPSPESGVSFKLKHYYNYAEMGINLFPSPESGVSFKLVYNCGSFGYVERFPSPESGVSFKLLIM